MLTFREPVLESRNIILKNLKVGVKIPSLKRTGFLLSKHDSTQLLLKVHEGVLPRVLSKY